MALILGTEYCKIDSNGRFKFPIALKKQLEGEDYRFVVRLSPTSECLELWPYQRFQEEVKKLQKVLNPYNSKDQKILRRLTHANLLDLDSNDRLMIPPEQRQVIKDAKEVALQSIGECIEIWERNAYENMNSEITDFSAEIDKRFEGLYGLPFASDAE